MDATATPERAPRPLIALIVIWVAGQLYTYIARRGPEVWPNDEPQGIAMTVGDVLEFIYGFFIIALVAYGLMRGQRFVWATAFVWQGAQAGFALVSLSLMNYQLDDFPAFAGYPFYGIVLPITVALISFVLLLLPATQRWLRRN